MSCSLRISTCAAVGAAQSRSEVATAARQMPIAAARRHTLGKRPLLNVAVSSATASAVPSPAAESPIAAAALARLLDFVASGGPEALKAAEKAAAKAAAKAAKKSAKAKDNRSAAAAAVSRREASSGSSSSSSSSSSSESDVEEDEVKGEGMIDVATLAVSLSRLGKREKRRKAQRSMRAQLAASSSSSTCPSSSPSSSSSSPASFDPDTAALTVMHTLSGSVALPPLPFFSLSAPSIDGEGQDRIAPPAFAVCVGPDCSRRGSQEVAAQLALAEKLRQDEPGGGGSRPREVVRCGCLGECGGRKGRLARGATAGKVEVEEVDEVEATALERSLAPLV